VPEDFKDENFRRMLVNAIYWTTRREPAANSPPFAGRADLPK
jgi:hypothetical protein